jgi:D-glucosaminate-6-phosphate ammonia-lyase
VVGKIPSAMKHELFLTRSVILRYPIITNILKIYEELGVKGIINAAGPKTRLSGSRMPKDVVHSIVDAASELVDLEYLQARASELISKVCRAEAGIVTSGAAAGLTLAASACLAQLDIGKMERLPETDGMKNEIVMARSQRNGYDHALRASGAKLIEFGFDEVKVGVGTRSVEALEIERAITERTVAIAYLAKPASTPQLREVVRVGNKHDLPVIVDAADELPPASNLHRFSEEGASLVVFSGGKAIRGPQASGILCGRRDLIMSAALQMMDTDCRFDTWDPPPSLVDKQRLDGLPRQGVGRGFKVGKEEVVGLMTALKIFVEEDDKRSDELSNYENKIKSIVESSSSIQNICAAYLGAVDGTSFPLAEIRFTHIKTLADLVELVKKMKNDSPPIYFDERRLDEMVLLVNPFNLTDKDVEHIIDKLKKYAAEYRA